MQRKPQLSSEQRRGRAISSAVSAALSSNDEAFADAMMKGILSTGCAFNAPIDIGEAGSERWTTMAMRAAYHDPDAGSAPKQPAIKAMARLGACWNEEFMGKSPMGQAAASGHLWVLEAMERSGGSWLGSLDGRLYKNPHNSPAIKFMLRVAGLIHEAGTPASDGLTSANQRALENRLVKRALEAVEMAIGAKKAASKVWLSAIAAAALAAVERAPSSRAAIKALDWAMERSPSLSHPFPPEAAREDLTHFNYLGSGHVAEDNLGLALAVAAGGSADLFSKIAGWAQAGLIPHKLDSRARDAFALGIKTRFENGPGHWEEVLAVMEQLRAQLVKWPGMASGLREAGEPLAVKRSFAKYMSGSLRAKCSMAGELGAMLAKQDQSGQGGSLASQTWQASAAAEGAKLSKVAEALNAVSQLVGAKMGEGQWPAWQEQWGEGFVSALKNDRSVIVGERRQVEIVAALTELSKQSAEGEALAQASLAAWAREIRAAAALLNEEEFDDPAAGRAVGAANLLFEQAFGCGIIRGKFLAEMILLGKEIVGSDWEWMQLGTPLRAAMDENLAKAERELLSESLSQAGAAAVDLSGVKLGEKTTKPLRI